MTGSTSTCDQDHSDTALGNASDRILANPAWIAGLPNEIGAGARHNHQGSRRSSCVP